MASEARRSAADAAGDPAQGHDPAPPQWLLRAEHEPWRHELFALLRRLCAHAVEHPRIGEASLPRQEFVRLGQQPSLVFAPREIAHPRQPPSAWPAHARWASAAQRLRPRPSAQGLSSALRDYLQVPVRVDEFELQWLELHPGERSRLGARDRGARLGDAAVLGARVPDRQGRFCIRVGPLGLAPFLELLPGSGGRALQALAACVRGFVGHELDWSLRLLVRGAELRAAALGGPDALARSAWLGDPRASADSAGLVAVQFNHPVRDPAPTPRSCA